jgi:tRNA-2-methylthio-N6-dimethylallyladenosine synthase
MNQKYYLHILGCQMNYSDAERVETVLGLADWQRTENPAEADFYAFVTCSVRQKAEDRVLGLLRELREWKAAKEGRKLGLTGCMARQTSTRADAEPDALLQQCAELDLVWRIEDTARLPELLGGGQTVYGKSYFSIMPARASQRQVWVPIMTGCDNWCTYCIVPVTRGREVSRPEAEILAECRAALESGAVEITLLGQNVNSYQKDKKAFARLLAQVAELPGLRRLRYTSSHPKDWDTELLAVTAAYPVIAKHLHLPAQHGDDEILRRMNRNYTSAEYLALLEQIRAKIPEMNITTDLIVGFPGESAAQFAKLVEFYRAAEFGFGYLSRYSVRRGTAAAELPDQVPQAVKAERWHTLNAVMKEYAAKEHEKAADKTLQVLVEGSKAGKLLGRSDEYYLVKAAGDAKLVGQIVPVRITQTKTLELHGEIVG